MVSTQHLNHQVSGTLEEVHLKAIAITNTDPNLNPNPTTKQSTS